jgi:hypothetical protein
MKGKKVSGDASINESKQCMLKQLKKQYVLDGSIVLGFTPQICVLVNP